MTSEDHKGSLKVSSSPRSQEPRSSGHYLPLPPGAQHSPPFTCQVAAIQSFLFLKCTLEPLLGSPH